MTAWIRKTEAERRAEDVAPARAAGDRLVGERADQGAVAGPVVEPVGKWLKQGGSFPRPGSGTAGT